MKVVNFPVTCAICNKKTSKRMDWLVFNDKKCDYVDGYLCPSCSKKEEEKICTVSRETFNMLWGEDE